MTDRSKSNRKTTRQMNRAQRKAQQVRMAETNVPAPIDMAVVLDQEAIVDAADTAPVQASRRTRRQAAQQQVSYVLPRSDEYAYISADLRRLIITAGTLLALMIVLLFLVD